MALLLQGMPVRKGDKVWNPLHGWGEVSGFDFRYQTDPHPIEVNFGHPVQGFANRAYFRNNPDNLFWEEGTQNE